MGTAKENQSFRLPILGEDVASALAGDIDIDAELRKLDEAAALGARPGGAVQTDHWYDQMVNPQFTKSQREKTTLLVSGLTAAHDYLVKGALTGLGYNVEVIDVPDNDALRYGKEFGNRGQCNPTYFTVGNLVKFLTERAAAGQARPARHGREVRLPDRGRVRPLPLRHVRHRVPQGAARRRLRRLPRDAVPAKGRPQAGDR